MENINFLYLTSCLFITDIISAFYYKYYLYGFLFIFLTITSICVHSDNRIFNDITHKMNILDKFMVGSVILYGGYVLYTKFNKNLIFNIIIISTFISCIFLYFYGCFHTNPQIAIIYHYLLHILASAGHNLIILL